MAAELKLVVSDYQGPDHWNWTLNDPQGNYLADQEVHLDQSKDDKKKPKEELPYKGYVDLPGYLKSYTVSDRDDDRRTDQHHLLADMGAQVIKIEHPEDGACLLTRC